MMPNEAGAMGDSVLSSLTPGEKEVVLGSVRFTMELHPHTDRHFNPYILRDGVWEPTETALFSAFLTSSETVLDLGANIGWYSLVAGTTLKGSGRVVAFEPEPTIGAILERNIVRNGLRNVEIVRAAVVDRETNACFVTTPHHVGDHHLVEGPTNEPTMTVAVTSIDAQWRRLGVTIDLIKIDTQGAELAIFRGMRELLSTQSRKPVIITEFWPHGLRRFGANAADLIDLMESFGYEAFLIDDLAKAARPIGFDDLRHRSRTDLAPADLGFIDLVLVPIGDSRRSSIEPFLQPYGSFEAKWRYKLRPTLAWFKRRLGSALKTAYGSIRQ
jgi:FkbM family methyltransferase